LKGLDEFDYLEFGVSSKDARLMNISTRKLIEQTFLALLDSSIDYRGKNIGCYMAGVAHDLWMLSGEVSAIFSPVESFTTLTANARTRQKRVDHWLTLHL
jgi:hypothetical protein